MTTRTVRDSDTGDVTQVDTKTNVDQSNAKAPDTFTGPTYMWNKKTGEARCFAAGDTCDASWQDTPVESDT